MRAQGVGAGCQRRVSARSHTRHTLPCRLLLHHRSSKTPGQARPVPHRCTRGLCPETVHPSAGTAVTREAAGLHGDLFGEGGVDEGVKAQGLERGTQFQDALARPRGRVPLSVAPWHLSGVTLSLAALTKRDATGSVSMNGHRRPSREADLCRARSRTTEQRSPAFAMRPGVATGKSERRLPGGVGRQVRALRCTRRVDLIVRADTEEHRQAPGVALCLGSVPGTSAGD